ncbi:MAG: tRNA (adenosine(37)-N6)-dimethylallyltransferase MiaA [Pseudoramibacter sp.]
MKNSDHVNKPLVPVLVGPTASGKTSLSIRMAKVLDGEIVSADSMQIYQKMDIGTAKPTEAEMQGIPHHLIDCIAPDQSFSVADYKERALAAIQDILSRHKLPFVVGGTGLYINALTQKWGFPEIKTSPEVRSRLEAAYEVHTPEEMHDKLKAIDPEAAEKIHPHNKKRVLRALEVYETTGRTKTYWERQVRRIELPYTYLLMGIRMPRPLIYERIDKRVDLMLQSGLVEEVAGLLKQGYDPSLVSMQALGYKEIVPYLKGTSTLAEQVRILKRDTRHFAKRQLTWFRKNPEIHWFDVDETANLEDVADHMIKLIQAYQKGEKNGSECH